MGQKRGAQIIAKAKQIIKGAYQIITKAKGSFALVKKCDAMVKKHDALVKIKRGFFLWDFLKEVCCRKGIVSSLDPSIRLAGHRDATR